HETPTRTLSPTPAVLASTEHPGRLMAPKAPAVSPPARSRARRDTPRGDTARGSPIPPSPSTSGPNLPVHLTRTQSHGKEGPPVNGVWRILPPRVGSEDLVARGEEVVGVVLVLGGVQPAELGTEVGAPVGAGHGEGADRVEGAAGGADPVVDPAVEADEPVGVVDVAGGGHADEV